MNEDTSVFVLKLWGNRQARRNFLSNVPSLGGRESVLTSNVYHRGRMIVIQTTYSISGIHIHSPFSRRDTEAKVFKKWSLKFCSRHVFIYCYRVWIGYIYTVIRSVHYLRRTDSLEMTLVLEKTEGRRRRGRQRMRWLDGIADSMDVNLSKLRDMGKDREARHAAIHGVTERRPRLSNWTTALSAWTVETRGIKSPAWLPTWRKFARYVKTPLTEKALVSTLTSERKPRVQILQIAGTASSCFCLCWVCVCVFLKGSRRGIHVF